jgi:hypothetical protein
MVMACERHRDSELYLHRLPARYSSLAIAGSHLPAGVRVLRSAYARSWSSLVALYNHFGDGDYALLTCYRLVDEAPCFWTNDRAYSAYYLGQCATFAISKDTHLALQPAIYAGLAIGTTTDVSIAVIMCWLLMRSRTGHSNTNSVVSWLLIYTINTGMLIA